MMRLLRAAFYFSGIVGCLMFSGLGLYSVNANGQVETVIDGYPVITTMQAETAVAAN
jgi:hypothetical protein